METVSEKEAIQRFAALMNGLIAAAPPTARAVIDAAVNFFREVRVAGAEDSLRFEWGALSPLKITRFVDTRVDEYDGWEDDEYLWVGVTREVAVNHDDDDTALSASVFFERAAEKPPSGNVACRLANLDARLEKFLAVPHVAELLARRPDRIQAVGSEVG